MFRKLTVGTVAYSEKSGHNISANSGRCSWVAEAKVLKRKALAKASKRKTLTLIVTSATESVEYSEVTIDRRKWIERAFADFCTKLKSL